MNYFKFALYNVIGGVAWVLICLVAGYQFGQIEFVKKRFELVLVAIVAISVLPAVIEVLRNRMRSKAALNSDEVGEPEQMAAG